METKYFRIADKGFGKLQYGIGEKNSRPRKKGGRGLFKMCHAPADNKDKNSRLTAFTLCSFLPVSVHFHLKDVLRAGLVAKYFAK
jgi:hypothetical protein